jgi:hypothetical protein
VAGIFWVAWLALGVWGLMRGRRGGRVVLSARLRGLRDWSGATLALSVASFTPALVPDASLSVQALLTLLASAGLLRLMHVFEVRAVGQGVVAGLGLIALVLDSLSDGVWAQLGALGHGTEAHGVGVQYGTLALLWGLIVARAWQQIEGNPLGAVLGIGALACWLGWAGLTPALGWGGVATALALGIALLSHEHTERGRVRLMFQNRRVRIVRRASSADLALTSGVLVGLCLLALWLSGALTLQPPQLGAHAGWQAGVVLAVMLGLRQRSPCILSAPPTGRESSIGLHGTAPSPVPVRHPSGMKHVRAAPNRAALPGIALFALLGGEPLAVLALGALHLWTTDAELQQEYPPRLSNLPIRTGGNE